MKIVVVGCGKIGEAILNALTLEGHDLVVVDNRDHVISEIVNKHDVMCVCGNGVDRETLSEAGVESAELFIAVTGSDELNMLSCLIAKRMGAQHTIARIRNPQYNDKSLGFLRQQLDISMSINPELLTAQELYHMLKLPSAVKVETFSRRNFEMIELLLKEDSPFIGVPLYSLRERHSAKFLVCVVQRKNQVIIPDAQESVYPATDLARRQLYTAISRAMHQVSVVSQGAIVPVSATVTFGAPSLVSSSRAAWVPADVGA